MLAIALGASLAFGSRRESGNLAPVLKHPRLTSPRRTSAAMALKYALFSMLTISCTGDSSCLKGDSSCPEEQLTLVQRQVALHRHSTENDEKGGSLFQKATCPQELSF